MHATRHADRQACGTEIEAARRNSIKSISQLPRPSPVVPDMHHVEIIIERQLYMHIHDIQGSYGLKLR